ncbi:MAG: V-type ATP synthase subunit D [Planctomycetota bacterium]|nr:V-type ATP synthase subunit D [Planctomycetota bacterium]
MIITSNATRMELMRLRRRLKLARRGHKLLKDKQDELMKQFMTLIENIKEMRENVDSHLTQAFRSFVLAGATMSKEALETAVSFPNRRVLVDVKTRAVMNVHVPVISLRSEGSIQCYGYASTSGELDIALDALDKVLADLVLLAEREKSLYLLAAELDKTRRRVNALEYTLIPNLVDTIKFIGMKLGEMERSNLSRLMRIKEIVAK